MKRVKLTESQLEMLKSIGGNDAKALADEINAAINSIDESMSYKDFANAVAIVLKGQYGEHNFEGFLAQLQSKL